MSIRHLTPLRLPAVAAAAPSGVADGDLWLAGDGVRARVGGATQRLNPVSGEKWTDGIRACPAGSWLTVPGGARAAGNANVFGSGGGRVVPVAFNDTITIDALGFVVTSVTGGSPQLRLGVYAVDPTTRLPATLTIDWGAFTYVGAGTHIFTLPSPFTFTPGMWGLAFGPQNVSHTITSNLEYNPYCATSSVFTTAGAYGAYSVPGVTGAWPATIAPTTLQTCPRWALRAA